jgi:2-polyprenyl-6-methoxyphenol hydroxylase-like FAD-dependent oxidoreductase
VTAAAYGGPPAQRIAVTCCIGGGGPAGLMLGFLLARAGVQTLVLEKHADFLRDFRGDTIHPSTYEVMQELGLLDRFLQLPHQQVHELGAVIGETPVKIADFRYLPTRCRFIGLMPQWDFLNFIAEEAARFPAFALRMQSEAVALIEANGRVVGMRAQAPDGVLEIRADLVVGADGRHSTVRAQAGLAVVDLGATIDVLWMRMSRRAEDGPATLGRFQAGRIFIMLNRGEYWQCAFVIPKGTIEEWKEHGIAAFREAIARVAPMLGDRVAEIDTWDKVRLLTVRVDRLRRWYRTGLLCIGDAAHAMSPVGGVGINLAIQDAVAAANRLAIPLREGRVTDTDLQAVQRRRELPTRMTQRLQLLIQDRLITAMLRAPTTPKPPLPVRLLDRFALLRRLPARLVGLGIRPEHARSPAADP